MNSAAKVYIAVLSVIGLIIGGLCTYQYITVTLASFSVKQEVLYFVSLAIISIISRCLPLYIRSDCTIDMSFISILAIVLTQGPTAAVAISFVTTPFIIIPSEEPGKKFSHIFNTAPEKTLFNTANLVLTIAVAGIAYKLTGGVAGNLALPGALLPAFSYIFVSIFINSIIVLTLFALNKQVQFLPAMMKNFLSFLPSIACCTPIGYFLALLLHMNSGEYLALLFMFPLLLARYSFKLYLDSKKQQYFLIRSLTAAIEAKDQYTEGHSRRVEYYSEIIARKMGVSAKKLEHLKVAALFHDVGKIGIDDAILRSPGALSEEERKAINRHPEIGVHILEGIDSYGNMKEMVLHHHERYDGKGYPDGTKGDDISLETYILSVADAFDAITSDRPYRKGMTLEKAEKIIREEIGRQFHPDVAKATLELIESGELQIVKGATL